jgi:competence protein ComEC
VAVLLVVFYYYVISFIAFINFKRPFVKKAISVLMVLAMIAFLGITKWQRTYRDNLVLTVLDVGHGQAIAAQLPGKANVLFDAGSLDRSDVSGRIVAPFLNYSGISKIDCIVISHNDVDHINGIPEIVEHSDVGDIYANDTFIDMKTDLNGAAKFLKTLLSKDGFKIKGLKDLGLDSAAEIKILWPGKEVSQDPDVDDNDKSAVLLIEFAGRKVLLCSDIEKFAQVELFRIYPDLKADVVVVPHHGSSKTAEKHFLENLDAEILICSCSRSQYERQQVIDFKGEAKTYYTPRDGAVAVYIDKDGYVARPSWP